MIVDFMGRISSVEFMARMDDYYENIRPYFHLLTPLKFGEKKQSYFDKLWANSVMVMMMSVKGRRAV